MNLDVRELWREYRAGSTRGLQHAYVSVQWPPRDPLGVYAAVQHPTDFTTRGGRYNWGERCVLPIAGGHFVFVINAQRCILSLTDIGWPVSHDLPKSYIIGSAWLPSLLLFCRRSFVNRQLL
jgi:hypothetical protein